MPFCRQERAQHPLHSIPVIRKAGTMNLREDSGARSPSPGYGSLWGCKKVESGAFPARSVRRSARSTRWNARSARVLGGGFRDRSWPEWLDSVSSQPLSRMWRKAGDERTAAKGLLRRETNFLALYRFWLIFLLPLPVLAQTPVECVRVISKSIEREVRLPGELLPYLSVPIHAKIAGFVDKVEVDRGSVVRKGQILLTLVAPETEAQIAEARSKGQAIQLLRAEAAAKLAAAKSTYDRLKAASQTPGVVAGNDLIVAEKNVEAAEALMNAYEGSAKAAEASVQSLQALEKYLTIMAPFDGIITDRNVHPGALAGPNSGTGSMPLLKLEQLNRLRLTVAVPETHVGGIVKTAQVRFTVPAFPGETFHGVIRRVAHNLDPKTRTMAVELDVVNPTLRLASGMYAEVLWPVRKERPALLVPPTCIATTTEHTFVVRIKNDVAEWVPVSRGSAAGELVEVYGPLQDGDLVARRGTDELREGTRVKVLLGH